MKSHLEILIEEHACLCSVVRAIDAQLAVSKDKSNLVERKADACRRIDEIERKLGTPSF